MRGFRSRDIALLDRVYEHVTLPPLITAAIDTPYIQRLRGLKQLGASAYLYPGAVHTRFEHSIGVAHLARTFLESLRRRQPNLNIHNDDVLMAMLAGLCHDAGHGPFSHLFEDVISKRSGVHFDHEEMSEKLLFRMLKSLGIVASDIKASPATMIDSTSCVNPTPMAMAAGISSSTTGDDFARGTADLMRGRGSSKRPYSQIISNKRNGIDVDRLDYLIRDSLCCFGKATMDVRVSRLMNAARIVAVPAGVPVVGTEAPPAMEYRLAFEEKMAVTIRELFALRAKLHKSVYQHHVVKAVGHMIGDTLALAAPHLQVEGKTLFECVEDEELFCLLGDWLLDAVAADPRPVMTDAKKVLKQLRTRQLYTLAGSINVWPTAPAASLSEGTILANLSRIARDDLKMTIQPASASPMGIAIPSASPSTPSNPNVFDEANIIVDVVRINHGKGAHDPLSFVDFFNPKELSNNQDTSPGHHAAPTATTLYPSPPLYALKGSSPLLSPSSFEENTVMIFSRSREPHHVRAARDVFRRWCDDLELAGHAYHGLSFHNPRPDLAS